MQLSKVLLGSTALLGVGAIAATDVFAASHSSVNVNGFVRFEVNGGDTEDRFGDGTEDFDFHSFGERVHHRYTDAMQTSGDLVGVVIRGVLELAARMQLGHDDLGRRDALA